MAHTTDGDINSGASTVADAFRAKVEEVATVTGKPADEVEAVLFAYLHRTAPESARMIVLSRLATR